MCSDIIARSLPSTSVISSISKKYFDAQFDLQELKQNKVENVVIWISDQFVKMCEIFQVKVLHS